MNVLLPAKSSGWTPSLKIAAVAVNHAGHRHEHRERRKNARRRRRRRYRTVSVLPIKIDGAIDEIAETREFENVCDAPSVMSSGMSTASGILPMMPAVSVTALPGN